MTTAQPPTLTYAPHTLVVFGGLFNGGPPNGDAWQCGIRVAEGTVGPDANDNGAPLATPAAYITDLQATLKTWFLALVGTVGCSGSATLNWIKVNNIGANGKYSDPLNTHRYDYAVPVNGPVTTAGQCYVMTLAYTWNTLRARGAGAHGRVYLPLGLPAQGSPIIGNTTNYATHGKNLLAAIARPVGAASAANGVFPIVASGRIAQNLQINGVKVGTVMDTQRRRKLQIPETYYSTTFP